MRQGTDTETHLHLHANEELHECQVDSGGTYSEVLKQKRIPSRNNR